MNLKKYLNKIQSEESAGMGFAIDSFPAEKKKKKKIIATIYPNDDVLTTIRERNKNDRV